MTHQRQPAVSVAETTAAAKAHEHLSAVLLSKLPGHCSGPQYDRSSVTAGICNLGTSNFALAHLGKIIDQVLPFDPTWGIVGCSIRTPEMIESLRRQDGLYVVVERENGTRRSSVVGSVVQTLFGPDDPSQIVHTIANPQIRLVTMTVTNKGYHTDAKGNLDEKHRDIQHDVKLKDGETPKTIYWYLWRGLSERKATGAPVTVVSLDNVPGNSRLLKSALLKFIRLVEPGLVSWVKKNVAFPCTTVDRITPTVHESFRHETAEQLGFYSDVVVGTEVFWQLVVEKSIANKGTKDEHYLPMPPWEQVGVQTVDNVASSWGLKFFDLNAVHALIAIVGQRLGLSHVHECMQVPEIRRLVERAHEEFAIFLGQPSLQYAGTICNRFSDSDIVDPLRRVGARTTSKVSERLLFALERVRATSGALAHVPVFVMACWLLNLDNKDEHGQLIDYDDAQAEPIVDLGMVAANWARFQSAKGNADGCHLPALADCKILRETVRLIGTTLKDQRFVRLSRDNEFIQHLGWALVALSRQGGLSAINALLEMTKSETA